MAKHPARHAGLLLLASVLWLAAPSFVVPRRLAATAAVAPALGLLLPAPAANAELSPPLQRAVTRYAAQLQSAMDFLYFDIKEYLRSQNPRVFQLAINAIDTSGGSNTALERDLKAPLRQLVLAGEEDGEVDFKPLSTRIEANVQKMVEAASARQGDSAIAAGDQLIEDLSQLFATVNKEAEAKVFLLPKDPEYDKRLDAYRSKMAEGKQKNLMRKDVDG
ncbi:unnamed protein product [Effrenium voratum]|uniref:Uncharacterized protein n=1 Tax=Effrenium voratum TaxID=2562239 RepID=A0AA36NEH6_9DINO|nr:unnamed protein product [Effrenium voratum]CAJ1444594.1 unnamed protein product [Effrenium voratum]CAJ1444595.1 unnamed protein product [Effrenium voratum]